MKTRILAFLFVIGLCLSTAPNVLAGDISISEVSYEPDPFKEGNTLHLTAKVTSTANISSVILFPCWEKPTYTCGMPKTMTDPDGDDIYEAEYDHEDWTAGNILHLNITVKDDTGGEKVYELENIEVQALDPGDILNEGDCETAGFHWWDGACHADPKDPSDYTDETTCEAAGYHWYGDACHNETGEAGDYTDKENCKSAGYHWYNGKCHAKGQDGDDGGIPGFGLASMMVAVLVMAVLIVRRR